MNPTEIALRGLVLMFPRYEPHPAKTLGWGTLRATGFGGVV